VRLFVALAVPAQVRENLDELIRELRPLHREARWVKPGNFHVTLKFIGEFAAEKLEMLTQQLAAVRAAGEIELVFRGLGFFPDKKRAKVIWAGMDAPGKLKELAEKIDRCTETLGVAREKREFSPHLTLARMPGTRLPEKLLQTVQQNAAREFGLLRTDEFQLIESKLRPSGAEYTVLASFPFTRSEA
jgi:RNA 2',3'-cyclic 3'-phosphodiesterase